MPPPQAPARRPSPALIVLVLALLLGLQPVTTDLYLPGLPALSAELGGAMGAAQLTLSALILSFGFGQLLLGPVSDRVGRRPVLLVGLGLYVGGAAACALAPNIGALVLFRCVQGVGMAAAVVCGRSMVRDLYEPVQGTAIMSKGQSGLGLFALASPVIGGVLAATLGWRSALAATGVIAAVALALVALALPETLRQRNLRALVPAELLSTWTRIARHGTFQAWSLLLVFTYGGLYTFLATSAFVYIDVLGTSRAAFGVFLGSGSLSYLIGTFACRRWIARHGIVRTVAIGGVFTLAGGLSTVALSLAGVINPWAIAVPQALYAFGHGIHQPCGQAGVVGPFPANAGAASALSGFMAAAGAFLIGLWLGQSMDGTVFPLTLTQGVFAVLTATVAWTMVQRHGHPR